MPKQQKSAVKQGQVRIIAGQWRGRRINFPYVPGLRPTGDRIRETLFNWLQADLYGAHCLDLFAGSGALGFEAASRQAANVVMVEKNRAAIHALQSNADILVPDTHAASTLDIIHQDAIAWLETAQARTQIFDIVFLDPPFDSDLLGSTLSILEASTCLSPNALIYTEQASQQGSDNFPFSTEHWQLHRQNITGAVDYRLYRRH